MCDGARARGAQCCGRRCASGYDQPHAPVEGGEEGHDAYGALHHGANEAEEWEANGVAPDVAQEALKQR